MSLYKQPGSAIWWVNITNPQRPRVRRSTGTADRLEAQRIHDEIKAGLWHEPRLNGKAWGDAVLLWCNATDRSESELLSLAKFSRVFKDRLLKDVTAESIDKALSFCKTAGTYTRYRTMIAAILNMAKDAGWMRDPPKLVARKNKTTKPRMWLTHEQWDALEHELPGHLVPPARFAITTGLRQANVLGLTWDRVDMTRKLVWVEGQDMKAGAAHAVPLSTGAVVALQMVEGAHATHCFTFRRKPIKDIKTAFMAACVRAGVGQYLSDGKKTRYEGFTWHGFRHTWATWHIQSGTPVEVLQKLGAWADLRMCLNYAHHTPGHLASYADNIERKEK